MIEIDSNKFHEEIKIMDDVATFILRYKNHVESHSRSDDIQCVQQCQHLLEDKCKEVQKLEIENEQLQTQLNNVTKKLADTNDTVRINFHEIENVLSDLVNEVCGRKKHNYEYDKIDEILEKTSKIIEEINNIYEK